MESFNFGAFDPTIGARIAAIPQEAQKQQTANMLQAMQMQGAMNQNELARYSLASAQRSDASQNAVNAALKGSIVDGKINYDLLTSNLAGGAGASKIPDFLKAKSEEEKRTQEIEKTKGDIAKQAREAVDSELTSFTKNAFKVTDVPSLTNHLKAFYENPLLGKIASKFKPFDQALNDDIKQISTPEGLRQWQAENANLTGKELTDLLLKVTTTTANLGDVSRETQRGGMGQTIGVPVDTPMGVSPNTTATINAARKNHLENLAQQGWTFDTERGIAVNARQGISRPISTLMAPVGGGFSAAPAVGGAPAPSIAAPGGGVPGQRQAPAGQPVAGPNVLGPKPEKPIWNSEAQGFIYPPSQDNPAGKFVPVQGMEGKSLTEVQAKSALFGSAMQQANTVITEIEKKGTFTSAIVPGLLEGIVKLAPLGVGDAAANAIESAFRTDPTGLIGPNENQQRLAQAQLGFAIGYLRSTSGAAFGAQEVANTIKEYFPLQGESKIVIKQKSASRERAIQGMRLAAGKSGSDFINKYVPKVNTETSPSNLSEPPPGAVRPRGDR